MYVFTNTINNKAKATNAFTIARRPSIQGAHMREKYLCKNLGVKEGGGHLPQGDIFSGTYGTNFVNGISHHKQLILYSHQTVWLPTLVAITTQHGGAEALPNFWYFYVNNVS